ncbi:Uncharacterized protein GBIM_00221 [Gryllus bimaculatus]|nr:Uncharacterized protein GBIM_00221 [Gryllus bimaculatus]
MASNSIAAHVLMKKGKRGAAAYVHADCSNSTSPQHLNELLDVLLNPGKTIDEWETIDWCKWLIAGGKTPDEFSSIVRRYDNATTCGLVWTANFVAYRCRTCGISPCMSLCAECFQNGNHAGHDFNMFRSQAGGACDCGDTSVMKETGFCDRHGPKAQVNKPPAPNDLVCVAEADADQFLTMLHDFSAMGAVMRRVMTGALTNPQIYKNLTECPVADSEYSSYMEESQRVYQEVLKSLPNPEPPDEYKDCPSLQEHLVHRTFLEELVFWTVKFEFPQKVVCLLLNMLPDPDYKEALTQAFVLHYSRISLMLERSTDPDTLSNRVVHVSVQLFSNESLAYRMAERLNLLHVMVISLKYMMSKILIQNSLHDPDKNFHYVVDCGRQVMKEHCYWPLVSDLNNVLSHRPVAVKFMSDDNLLEMWFSFLSLFQGMNVNQRELTQHVEFEPNTYYAAFSAELEASAYPMWALVSHLRDSSTVDLTKSVLSMCLAALQEWLEAVNFTHPGTSDELQVSFHLPLHRYLSVFMCQAVRQQGVPLREVLPPRDLLALIMMHPLRVQLLVMELNRLTITIPETYSVHNCTNLGDKVNILELAWASPEEVTISDAQMVEQLDEWVLNYMEFKNELFAGCYSFFYHSFLPSFFDHEKLIVHFLEKGFIIARPLYLRGSSIFASPPLSDVLSEEQPQMRGRNMKYITIGYNYIILTNIPLSALIKLNLKCWYKCFVPFINPLSHWEHVLRWNTSRNQTKIVAFYEILSGMWVRNGLQIKGQAMTYIQCNFCNSMVDADLYLLQVCATQLPAEAFLCTVMDKFNVLEWMSLAPYASTHASFLEGEHDAPMLESCLTFLATLMSVRTNLGVSEAPLSQLELVTLLCMGDKTHSQLIELMPERCSTAQSRDFEAVLAEVADYRAPNLEASGNMQQGMYVPRPQVWEKLYDPIHVLLRAVHRRDFQTSMDRFTEQAGKFRGSGAPWPPFRPPAPCHPAYEDPQKLLRSRVFHAAAFVVLHRAVHGQSVSEHVMALTVYLLEMAVASAEPLDPQSQVCQASHSEETEVTDKDLSSFYSSDWLSSNLRKVIHRVRIEPKPAVVFDSSDSEIEWEGADLGEAASSGPVLMLELGAGAGASDESGSSRGVGDAVALVPGTEMVPMESPSPSPPPSALAAASSSEGNDVVAVWGEMVAVGAQPPSTPPPPAPSLTAGDGGPSRPGTASASSPPLPHPTGTEMVPAGAGAAAPPPHVRTPVRAGPSGAQASIAWAGPSGQSTSTDVVPVATPYPRLARARRADVLPSTSAGRKPALRKRKQVMPGSSGSPDALEVNESIISLLLKLHSHLAGTPDSFNPDEAEAAATAEAAAEAAESRVGDGPFFLGKLLHRVSALDAFCREAIREARDRLWPRKPEEGEEEAREREAREREERRRRAKERQQKLMAEFASKQKEFMERAMETDEEALSGMDWREEEGATLLASKRDYDCVICSQTTPSTEDKPMGLVVLVQATSVLGHKRRSMDRAPLPTSDEERGNLRRDDSLASEFDRRVEELNMQFDSFSWQLSVNLGWEGGVHVQTCGHHLHLDCLRSYLQSLRSQQRQQSIAVDRGEYWCPLCRQLANSVLPLSPQLGECAAVVRSRPAGLPSIVTEVCNFLKENPPTPMSSSLVEAMAKSMEDMTNSTYHKFKQKSASPTSQSLFLFVSSIARTNLEVELVQRGGSLCQAASTASEGSGALPGSGSPGAEASALLTPKRSCIVPLLHVLAMHARLLATWPAWQTWQKVAGAGPEPDCAPLALAPLERQVPLLLHDPAALLTQFILLLPLHLDQTYFSCVVKVLYNLLYFQVVAQLSCHLPEAERARRRSCPEPMPGARWSLDAAVALVVQTLEHSQLYLEGSTESSASSAGDLEMQVQQLCLPFLRLAALLRHHLYEQPLPDVTTPQSEFVRLVYYLELVSEGMDWQHFNAAVALNWAYGEAGAARAWCEEMAAFAHRSQVSARNFLAEQHLLWQQPRLLRLPELYDRIFQYYHRRQCTQCHSVPRETSICLLCGALVCLRENCCKQHNVCEAVQHSIDCGGGTAMYLVVTSSYILVIRGKRACLWGSVYLDSFGEEDRELKRGKPLYLSPGRYQLLEQQWLAHRFDHTSKKWVWHRDVNGYTNLFYYYIL